MRSLSPGRSDRILEILDIILNPAANCDQRNALPEHFLAPFHPIYYVLVIP